MHRAGRNDTRFLAPLRVREDSHPNYKYVQDDDQENGNGKGFDNGLIINNQPFSSVDAMAAVTS